MKVGKILKDYLIKALVNQSKFRVYVIKATRLVNETQKSHQLTPSATQILGESLIATLLLSTSMLKNDEMLTTRLIGNGPIGAVIADANAQGQVKGYLQNLPTDLTNYNKQSELIGNQGRLSVTKDQKLAQPFTGEVPLISGDIAQNYAYYLAKSEQIPAAIGLVVNINAKQKVISAGGFMIQALPNTPTSDSEQIIQQIRQLPSLKRIFTIKSTPEMILTKLFKQTDTKILQKAPVEFHCDCSKARFARSLAGLDSKELQALITEQHGAETVCRFCGQAYQFTSTDLQKIIAEK
ncbi:Hsp33 family molecular chaperone HslO [Bombilactobacillus bombi]|uniref:Hsp33 family molecular chaperone HslO n=1 Tax=Bombilactobacillus bombi TaxID=1303590 RepID=UPI0038F6FD08